MYIQKINFTPTNYTAKQSKKEIKNTQPQTKEQIETYRPYAYMDYNINFSARLFRSPENFYEQDFNKNNMPKTMKAYLYSDYEKNKKLAPAFIFKTVFEDIDYARDLEEVKELYPNEPLFEKLHYPNMQRSREGILAEIAVMKDEGTPLFKSGEDDLGMYILKKIYREGKTLNEINKDFRKDISKEYEALSDISYSTINNFGIKFPKLPFWKSFYVTRDDFPYEYKPRTTTQTSAGGKREYTLGDINRGNIPKKPKLKFEPKEHEVEKYKDILIDSMGNQETAKKEFKKRNYKKDDEKVQFIQKYMGEIMSIALDRVHASEEMRSFFETYESLDKSSKARMKHYWDNTPEMKALQGLIMSDTIKLFFLTYGADGKNEEFKDLIDYAHSIKPAREEQQRIHDEKQAEYERELGIFETEEKEIPTPKTLTPEEQEKIRQENIFKQHNMQEYILTAVDGSKVRIDVNLKDGITKYINSQFEEYYPKAYINKYYNFFNKHPLATEKYKLSLILRAGLDNQEKELDKYLMGEEEIKEISNRINNDFKKKYPKENRALLEGIVKVLTANESRGVVLPAQIYEFSTFTIISMFDEINRMSKEMNTESSTIKNLQNNIDNYYNEYNRPLKSNETSKIVKEIEKYLLNYKSTKLTDSGYIRAKGLNTYLTALSLYLIEANEKERRKFFTLLNNYIQQDYGASARSLLENQFSDTTHWAKIEDIILCYAGNNSKYFAKTIASNPKVLMYLASQRDDIDLAIGK